MNGRRGRGVMTPENVARDYEGLKGLSDVALGLGFLTAVLVALATQPWGWGPIVAPLAGVLVLQLMLDWSKRRYARTVGSARSSTFTGRSLVEVVGFLVVVPALLVALGVDLLERTIPLLFFPAVWAVLLVLVMRRSLAHVGLTPVHLAAVGVMALAALAPLALPLDGALARAAVGCGAVGLALLATGLTDHRRLMQAVGARSAGSGGGQG